MRQISVFSIVFLTLLAAPVGVHAFGPKPVEVEAAFGANICVKNGLGECTNFDALMYGRFGVHYRLLPNMSIGVDVDAGGLTPDVDAMTYWALHVSVVMRAMYRAAPGLRVFTGVGIGFGHIEVETPVLGATITRTVGAFSVKVPLGVKFRLASSAWLGVDAAFHAHLVGDECIGSGGSRVCAGVGSEEVEHAVQVGVFFAYHL